MGKKLAWAVAFITLAAAAWWITRRPVIEDRVYVIGYEHTPPNQVDRPGEEPTGFAVELAREAARRRGIRLRWEKHHRNSENAVAQGLVDFWPLMTITAERQKKFYFTAPYQEREMAFLVRADSPYRLASDVRTGKVASHGIMIMAQLLRQYMPGVEHVAYPDMDSAVRGMCAGEVLGVFGERYPMNTQVLEGALCPGVALRLLPVTEIYAPTAVASTFAARPAADAIREAIGEMIDDGTASRIASRWSAIAQTMDNLERLQRARRQTLYYRVGATGIGLLALLSVMIALAYRKAHNQALAAAHELERKDRELRLLTASLGEMVLAYGANQKLTFCNPGAERLTGLSLSQLQASAPGSWACDEDRATVLRAWGRAFAGQDTGPLVYRLARPDGEVRWVSAVLGPIRDEDGRQSGAQSVETDVTERREAEQRSAQLQVELLQSQKLESLGRLAGGVAHDFNNLLTVIRGYAQLLEADLHGRQGASMATQIVEASDRAAELTSQLLAIGRKQPVEPQIVDLNEIVSGAISILRRLIGEDIELSTHMETALPRMIAAPGQIHQILMNLAANARDAIRGSGTLVIETGRRHIDPHDPGRHLGVEPGDYVQLSVTDNGRGMDAETLGRVFEPFFTTKDPGKGTGLGLSIVYGIVKQAGGSVWVYSEPGQGTSFKMIFPAVEPETAEAEQPELVTTERGQETILVVEDQDMVRSLACEVLSGLGYRVLDATQTDHALEVARAYPHRIDLLLTDVIMPGRNGRELAEELTRERPETKVLYMSGYSDHIVEHRGVLRPGLNYLAKPFSPQELGHRVRRVLDEG